MAGYIVYWPKDQIQNLKKEQDSGPITVVFGSAHSRMPTIKSVKVGDIVFPVTLLWRTHTGRYGQERILRYPNSYSQMSPNAL